MSRSLLDLEPRVGLVVGEWLRVCNSRGVTVLVYCTKRTLARQFALWRQGRELKRNGWNVDKKDPSNWVRIPGGKIVTQAKPGFSFHNYGLAVDAAPHEFLIERGVSIKRKLDWTPFDTANAERRFRSSGDLALLDERWVVMVEAADELGLEWAGRWPRFVEYVHFSLTGGVSLAQLRGAA